MKNAIIQSVVLGGLLVAGASRIFAQAQSGYLDSGNDLFNNTGLPATGSFALTNGEEFGNEVVAAGAFNDNIMTNFAFEYFGSSGGSYNASSFNGNVQLTINFYVNNGPSLNGYLSPSATPFYTWSSASDGVNGALNNWLSPTPGLLLGISVEGGDIVFGQPGVTNGLVTGVLLPSKEFTYTVTFTGLTGDDTIGVDAATGSSIGTVYSGYWVKEPNGAFQYLVNGGSDSSIAQIQGVPEPTSLALVGIGGLAMLAAAKRRLVK